MERTLSWMKTPPTDRLSQNSNPRRERGDRRGPPSPLPLPPAAAGRAGRVGGVLGWRMLLPTGGRGRNGNRNRGRRLTEPSAPLTEGKRKAARARQRLTARDRARAGSRARDPEQRRPHSVRKGRDGLAGSREGAAGAWSPENPATRVGPRPRAHAPEWLRPGAQAGKPPAGASERACARGEGARAPRRPSLLGEGAHAPAAASTSDPGMCTGSSPSPSSVLVDSGAAASTGHGGTRAPAGQRPCGSSGFGLHRRRPPEDRRLRGTALPAYPDPRGPPPRGAPRWGSVLVSGYSLLLIR